MPFVLARMLEPSTLEDEADAQWFNLATVLEYFDIFENLAVRDSLTLF